MLGFLSRWLECRRRKRAAVTTAVRQFEMTRRERAHAGISVVIAEKRWQFRVLDIQNRSVMVHGVRKTSPEIDQAYRRFRLKPGDLLSIRGHVGRMGIVPSPLNGANITQDTARLAPVDAIDSKYLMGCLGSSAMQHQMDALTRGAAVQGINLGGVKELPVPVPPLPLQRQFAAIVDHHTQLSATHRESLRQAEHLFQMLLHGAFTSEL
jgi:type I restriction enzyme, S subunit